MSELKLYAGPKIRRLRKGLDITQAEMAQALGVSASYLTLIERDQRPVSARVLVRLAQVYDLDLGGLADTADDGRVQALREAAADPVLAGFDLQAADLRELAERQPHVADAMVRMHTALRDAVADAAGLADHMRAAGSNAVAGELPIEEVRDAFQANDNHYPVLEDAAEAFLSKVDLVDGEIFAALTGRLREAHGVATRIMPYDVMGEALRRYDPHPRRLLLSEMLEPSARIFQVAFQIGLFEEGEALDALVAQARLTTPESRSLYRVNLASYFAAAVMMPYERFRAAAEALRYDLDVLSRRFSASHEQVCHRLTTLRRSGARGVPFFLIRVDQAGNVSKRFGGRVFHFARSGGACPRWNLYDAFRTPARVLSQLVELPDGARFFTIAKAIRRPGAGPGLPGQVVAVGLGCEAAYAPRLVYADSLPAGAAAPATPIGITCRLCERAACPQRAHPPLGRRVIVDEARRGFAPFAFRIE